MLIIIRAQSHHYRINRMVVPLFGVLVDDT